MKIGILGTGIVGQTFATALLAKGHQVMIGTRDVAASLASTEKNAMGMPPFADWHRANAAVQLGTFAEVAGFGDLLLNATAGGGSIAALQAAGADQLGNKILLDIANPLDFSKGMPPTLSIINDNSLGETIQQAFPNLRVVKTLNTMTAFVMVHPEAIPGDHTVFVCGNDAEAKAHAKTFLQEQFGWKYSNIIDLGDISQSRGTEQLLALWIRLYGALQTPMFNFHVVVARPPAS